MEDSWVMLSFVLHFYEKNGPFVPMEMGGRELREGHASGALIS